MDVEGDVKVCNHEDVYILKSCCSTADRASNGLIECGCNGLDAIVCDSPNCSGVDDDFRPDFINDCWE